jgi:hypothetical protein
MVDHFLGWQTAPTAAASNAIAGSLSQLNSQLDVSPTATGDIRGLGVVRWAADRLSIRLEKQLAAAGQTFGLTTLTANPVADSSLLELAQTLDLTFRAAVSDGKYVLSVRHPAAGVPYKFANGSLLKRSSARILNAGDGANEDPITALAHVTALSVLLPIPFGSFNFVLVGDFVLDGLARSVMWLLFKAGANVQLVGHPSLVPSGPLPVASRHSPTASATEVNLVLYFPLSDQNFQERASMSSLDYEIAYIRPLVAAPTRLFCLEEDLIGEVQISRLQSGVHLKDHASVQRLGDDVLFAASVATLLSFST